MENSSCMRVYADIEQIEHCKEKVENAQESFVLLSSALSLAGNEVRLKILYLLYLEDKLCVCDLSDVLSMTAPAVSQHLRKLKDAGVIRSNRVSQTIFYSVNEKFIKLFEPFFKKIENNQIFETT